MKIRMLLLGCICVCVLVGSALMLLNTPPAEYEDYWKKTGYTASQTRDMLYGECGFREKTDEEAGRIRNGREKIMQEWLALFAESERCMLKNGFIYTDTPNGHWGKCDQNKFKEFPSCQSLRQGKQGAMSTDI